MPKFVVDTHALIWFLAGDPKLGKIAYSSLSDARNELILPSIAYAEALWIISRRSTGLTLSGFIEAIENDPRVTVYPLNKEIVDFAQTLSGIAEMHDRQIAATALVLSSQASPVVLLTKDADIVASGLVSVAW